MEKNVKIDNAMENIVKGIQTAAYKDLSLVEWRMKLANECQVYVFDENYLAKRFDQINYKFCTQNTAKEILVDNLYSLLRFKYFPKSTDEIEKRIKEIVNSFIANIKTTLIRISFNPDTECKFVQWLPDACVAFRNGVYDFKNNCWLFKYQKIHIADLHNNIYIYNPDFIIMWYVNIEFEPLEDIDVKNMSLSDFIELMKVLDKESKNYCFELMYNMAHDQEHQFKEDRFKHLCQVLGYTCLQSFSQNFILLIGSGQNGKNSLFDGCFSSRVIPMPANADIDSIEDDKFITGALENKAQNIFLETKPEMKSESKMLKAITGGMYQSIEHKGEDRYSGIINCKFIWAGNDQDKIKFADTTHGFIRRINIFETWYKWDEKKKFLKNGDYYDTTFSEDLHELKNDIFNVITFIYLAMFGIKEATANFTKQFKFTKNDWKLQYSDINIEFKDAVEKITTQQIRIWLTKQKDLEIAKSCFFDKNKMRIYSSDTMKEIGINNYNDFIEKFLTDEETVEGYFMDNRFCYMSVRHLQDILKTPYESTKFTQLLKKTFNLDTLTNLYNNRPYVKVKISNNRLKILN